METDALKFDEKGLIPAVVQDFDSKRVLTLAYMNRESLEITLKEGRTCFWSRSRQRLWRKGETSGNYQNVVKISADCDGDALLVEVKKEGPACHLGNDSCFEFPICAGDARQSFSIGALYELLNARKEKRPERSYTAYLFEKGKEKILKKVGEESAEVIIAAMKGSREETIYELADLLYHCLVLMAQEGITPEDILAELEGRYAPKGNPGNT